MPESEIWRRKFKQLAALSEAISRETKSAGLLEKAGKELLKLTGANSGVMLTYYNNSIISIARTKKPRSSHLTSKPPFPIHARRWDLKKRGAFLSNEAAEDFRVDATFVQSHAIRNLIAVPIQGKDKISALIVLANKRGGFNEFDLNLASIVASQTQPILRNLQSRAEEQRRAHQLNLLNELVTEISLIRDPQQLLKTAIERIQQHFSYYRVAAGWVDESTHEIKFVHVLSRNVRAASKNTDKVKSVVTSRVKIGDSVIAVLEIQSDNPDAFDASDRMVLDAVTSALGSAIQNANAYQNLEKINAKLEEASKLKEEILQIVAHDFRSPLTVIRGYMDQLIRKEKWLDLEQKEIMQTVSQQAFRLQKLADATLKASRFDSGDISFSFEKTDFDSFLQHLVFPWSEKHHFVVNTESDLPIIKGDSGRLQEVMENLLTNAIKYSPEGGDVKISLRKVSKKDIASHFETDPEGESFLLVSVSDKGIGIPPDKTALLFRRFARLHELRRIEGIGLGLYITRKIIEAHGGKIWLQEQKKGACFSFALPEYKSTFAENIIVVEDDTLTLRLLHRAISGLGYEVITAWDGKEAMDKIVRFQPRLIITDLMLPEMSGEELIRRIRLHPELASIPIIVFTGKRDYNLEHAPANLVRVVFKHEGVGAIVKLIQEILTTETQRIK